MLPYFVFYEYLAVAQTTTTTSDVFFRFSLEWPDDALFGKEMTVGLGLGLFCDALSSSDMNVYLSVHLESWNRCTCTSLSDCFHFLLVKRVLKYVWRRTSAALNQECFHGHQVKLKQVSFPLSHSKQLPSVLKLFYSGVKPSNDYWRVHILVWMLLQDISDRIRLSRTVQRTYFIIYEFCFTCLTVEYKMIHVYLQSSSNETIVDIQIWTLIRQHAAY